MNGQAVETAASAGPMEDLPLRLEAGLEYSATFPQVSHRTLEIAPCGRDSHSRLNYSELGIT